MFRIAAFICLLSMSFGGSASQIAPLGSKLEARLTNENDSTLARFADRLGFLIKEPVHEEITQLGFDCPVDRNDLVKDNACRGGDTGYANPYIIYGVRWNDLPPFLLNTGQGRGCKKLFFLDQPACNVSQTVRFATQPDCWLCLFWEAEKKGATKKITGCEKGKDYEQGNLMTRSHFGDLQFLHAMANEEGIDPKSDPAEDHRLDRIRMEVVFGGDSARNVPEECADPDDSTAFRLLRVEGRGHLHSRARRSASEQD